MPFNKQTTKSTQYFFKKLREKVNKRKEWTLFTIHTPFRYKWLLYLFIYLFIYYLFIYYIFIYYLLVNVNIYYLIK